MPTQDKESRRDVNGNKKIPGTVKPASRKKTERKRTTAKTKTAKKVFKAEESPKAKLRPQTTASMAKIAASTPNEEARRVIIECYKLANIADYAGVEKLLTRFPIKDANQKQKAAFSLLEAIAKSNGNENEKLNMLLSACKNDQSNPFLVCYLGIEYARSGDAKNAQACLTKAKKINPDTDLINLLGKRIKAIEAGQYASREKIALFNSIMLSSLVYMKKGKYEDVLKTYLRAGQVLINVNLAESTISLLGKLKKRNLEEGRICAKLFVDVLGLEDCQTLHKQFAKRGDQVVLAFLEERIMKLQ